MLKHVETQDQVERGRRNVMAELEFLHVRAPHRVQSRSARCAAATSISTPPAHSTDRTLFTKTLVVPSPQPTSSMRLTDTGKCGSISVRARLK